MVTRSPLCIVLWAGGLAPLAIAQDTEALRTEALTDAHGVYFDSRTAAATVQPDAPSPAGLRWSLVDPVAINESVSVGYGGTLAWIGKNLNEERIELLATTEDGTPPVPIWTVSKLGADALRVAAADAASVCAAATVQGGASTLELYSAYSTTPTWTVSYGTSIEIAISDDGRFVSAGYTPASNTSQVDVYDVQGANPTTPIAMLTATSNSFRHHDLSGDGSTVLMATQTDNHVFDVASGVEIFQDSSTVSHDAHAIDADGSAWGRGGFNPVRAWVRQGSTYNLVLDFRDTALGFAVFTAADVSADGSTFVVAGYDSRNSNRMRVHCFDLTTTPMATLLWTFDSTGSGSLQTSPRAVSVSDDGRWIAVANWGVANNAHPEGLLFDRDAGSVPIATLDTPGSAFDTDVANDGQFWLLGTKGTHANISGNGGEADCYDRGGQTLWVTGTPSVGSSFALEASGAVGDNVFLAFAAGFGPGITIPGVTGAFELDPATLFGVFPVGSVPASGSLALGFTVPGSPAIVGSDLTAQALPVPTFAFTNPVLLPITP